MVSEPLSTDPAFDRAMVVSGRLARLRLARVQTLALTALVPVVGALVFMGVASPGEPLGGWEDLLPLILLFIVGGLFHVFGFVLNEWADLDVDSASSDLSDKPLVAGDVSARAALSIAVGAAIVSFIPLALVTQDPWAFALLGLAIAMGAIYDLYGKRVPLDLVLAGSLTLLLATGVVASGEFDPGSRHHLIILACLAGLQFMQNLFQNAIEGGMKDADHDAAAGARTYAAVLGVHVRDGNLIMGRGFRASSLAIKALSIGILGLTVLYLADDDDPWQNVMVMGLVTLFAIVMVVTLGRFMMSKVEFDRGKLKRTFSIHEMATFAATIAAFIPLIGLMAFIAILLLPIIWFVVVNRLLFNHALEPGV